jgi:hypothetical protein
VKAVDYYAHAFPGDVHGDEIRWILAERIRFLSQRGGSEEAALRRQAHQQYERLEASKGPFTEKARVAMERFSAPARYDAAPDPRTHKEEDSLEIVGGSGTQTSNAKSTPHEVLVLNRAEVIVRMGAKSQFGVGTAVQGHVAHPVRTNGIVAIPAGATCQLIVVSTDASHANIRIGLTSIEIDHRAYAVKSSPISIAVSGGGKPTADRTLTFHLNAPLVIER